MSSTVYDGQHVAPPSDPRHPAATSRTWALASAELDIWAKSEAMA